MHVSFQLQTYEAPLPPRATNAIFEDEDKSKVSHNWPKY